MLVPEVSVDGTVRPNKENSTNNTRDEVVGPPPSLDARTIDYQNGLSDSQGAVVPNNQEHYNKIKNSVV